MEIVSQRDKESAKRRGRQSTIRRLRLTATELARVLAGIILLLLLAACRAQAPAVSQTAPPTGATKALPSPKPITSETPVPTDAPTSTPAPTQTPFVETLRDLPYWPEALPSQSLDLYLPAGEGSLFSVILMLRGGGDDKTDLADLANRFAKLGFAVASANYRDTMNMPYPAAVEDAYCALAWLHANAEPYRLDTQHIYALGHSSGGTLAAMLGVVDEPGLFQQACPHPPPATGVQGVITFTGLFDYPSAAAASKNLRTYLNNYLGAEWSAASDLWAQASPITWVDGSEPPFLLVHGAADRNIPPDQSEAFAAALQAAGVPVELLLVPNADHVKILRHADSLVAVETFLASLLAP